MLIKCLNLVISTKQNQVYLKIDTYVDMDFIKHYSSRISKQVHQFHNLYLTFFRHKYLIQLMQKQNKMTEIK